MEEIIYDIMERNDCSWEEAEERYIDECAAHDDIFENLNI